MTGGFDGLYGRYGTRIRDSIATGPAGEVFSMGRSNRDLLSAWRCSVGEWRTFRSKTHPTGASSVASRKTNSAVACSSPTTGTDSTSSDQIAGHLRNLPSECSSQAFR
jgi:hypothetical protein